MIPLVIAVVIMGNITYEWQSYSIENIKFFSFYLYFGKVSFNQLQEDGYG